MSKSYDNLVNYHQIEAIFIQLSGEGLTRAVSRSITPPYSTLCFDVISLMPRHTLNFDVKLRVADYPTSLSQLQYLVSCGNILTRGRIRRYLKSFGSI